jgi:RNA polymerase sigma-70 factor (ECF subfamily)
VPYSRGPRLASRRRVLGSEEAGLKMRRGGARGLPRKGLAGAAGRPVGRFASGRVAAEELFDAGYPRLAGWVAQLTGDDRVAHEIATEAFARLLGRWSRLDNPHGYLYMIAANLVSDHWRKSGTQQRAPKKLAAAHAGDFDCYPAQAVDARALIEALPPRLRTPFLLHHYAGFEVQEVAAMLGRPEATSRPTCITRACG